MAVLSQVTPEQQRERAILEGWGYDGSMATEQEVLHLLTALVLVAKPDVVVETGTFNGHGTKAIQAGLKANRRGHLWTVECDPELCKQYAEKELERVTFVEADSAEWSASSDCPEEIDFAFVDCAHDPEDRVRVFAQLLPRVRIGGMICVHDSEFYRYEDYLDRLVGEAGPYSLHLPALNGFTLWRFDGLER